MIWKNFRRELAYTTSRLISVIIITAVAVLMHVALSGVIYNGDRIANDYYRTQNVASYWITGTGFDRGDCRKLQKIEGVLELQPRIMIDAEDRYNQDVTLTLYGIADGYLINTPFIVSGDFPKDNREMMISSAFAEKHGLKVGDTYEMKIKSTGMVLRKRISALIKSPECMYHVNATSLMPDFERFGFAYMNEEALQDIFGENVYNQICITTAPDAGDAQIKHEISKALRNKVINVLALEDNAGAYYLLEQINGLRTILVVFPLIFFFVAILIMFSTMSRLIENARPSIGTMKALGYYDGTILLYYLLYSVLVVLLGFIAGVIPAGDLITKPIANTLFFMLDMPDYRILPDQSAWGVSFLLTCLFCIGTAFIVTIKALDEKPAECMRPKPPKELKKCLIEKIPFIWKRLSFSQKYITRNIFRNKTRMAICIIGIAGCMTLILTSFAIKDSLDDYVARLSGNAHRYDILLTFDSPAEEAQYRHFDKMNIVTGTQFEMATSAKVYSFDQQETAAFTVTEDVLYLKLIDILGPNPFSLPEDGIVMENKTALKLGLKAGDTVSVKFTGDNKIYNMRIASTLPGIHGIYAGKSYWRSLGKGFMPTSAYIKTSDIHTLTERISNFDFAESFESKETITGAITSQMSSLSMIVFILILFGAILALVVLYNLGIMSFYEQIRNLATLLVLGFHDKETKKLTLTENIVFTIIGIIIGIPFGAKLAGAVLSSVNTFAFALSVKPVSYIISAVITLCFAVIVNMILGKKTETIDMLGALKSVE